MVKVELMAYLVLCTLDTASDTLHCALYFALRQSTTWGPQADRILAHFGGDAASICQHEICDILYNGGRVSSACDM